MHRIVEFAREVLGVKLYDGQAEVLGDYYQSGRPNWLLLAGRRGGKSLISDVIVCFEAVVPDLSQYIREGETRHILIVSTRLDNATLHIRNIGKLLRHSKDIGRLIVSELQDRIELSNGVVIQSLPCSARAGRGYGASTVVFDELAFFQDVAGNASSDIVFESYMPVVATFGDAARVIITTTPNVRAGIVFSLYDRANSGELQDFFITQRATRELNPKVSERTIKGAMARDAESAQAEYFAQFRENVESFLNGEAVDQCVDKHLQRTEKPMAGRMYVAAIDPAVAQDRYAFAVCHLEGDTVILDYLRALKPPINPAAAESLLLELVKSFNPTVVRCDTPSTVQRLKNQVAALEYFPFSRPKKLQIYGSLKECVNLQRLVIYPDDDLIEEMKFLQIRGGGDISAPKSGRCTHDDMVTVLALCVDALLSGEYQLSELTVLPDPFAYWGGDFQPVYERAGKTFIECLPGTEKHRPGVTVENCNRNGEFACIACVRELQQSGYYTKYEEEAMELQDKVPMTKEEADSLFYSSLNHPGVGDQARAEKFKVLFLQQVRNQARRGE